MENSGKLLIIINGKGGVGKDTLCGFAAKHYQARNVSSITPIKGIAAANGWNGEKTPKARKFLADLKEAFTQYNDLPTNYLLGQYQDFLAGNEQLMFAHIREGSEIDKLKQRVTGPVITLLVRCSCRQLKNWGNSSDDQVEQYPYDWIYDNSKPLKEAEEDFLAFLKEVLKEVGNK